MYRRGGSLNATPIKASGGGGKGGLNAPIKASASSSKKLSLLKSEKSLTSDQVDKKNKTNNWDKKLQSLSEACHGLQYQLVCPGSFNNSKL